MIRIAITEAAFKAITATLPLGSVAYEAEVTAKGERLIWIEPSALDRLRAMRGPGESYSDDHPVARRTGGDGPALNPSKPAALMIRSVRVLILGASARAASGWRRRALRLRPIPWTRRAARRPGLARA